MIFNFDQFNSEWVIGWMGSWLVGGGCESGYFIADTLPIDMFAFKSEG